RKGPRGGGREAPAIVRHVLESEAGYLSALGRSFRPGDPAGPAAEALRLRDAVREGLAAAARGEIPPVGPRGGRRWSPRYFVRRAAWHLLDHAWEIEDRLA
ncbi:MAG TPA: hypothetical protein VNN10_13375, partial [Dehalococcoidia bacterium]|nr:hypothetical protein [Dehalococcoidia bacterium]